MVCGREKRDEKGKRGNLEEEEEEKKKGRRKRRRCKRWNTLLGRRLDISS